MISMKLNFIQTNKLNLKNLFKNLNDLVLVVLLKMINNNLYKSDIINIYDQVNV